MRYNDQHGFHVILLGKIEIKQKLVLGEQLTFVKDRPWFLAKDPWRNIDHDPLRSINHEPLRNIGHDSLRNIDHDSLRNIDHDPLTVINLNLCKDRWTMILRVRIDFHHIFLMTQSAVCNVSSFNVLLLGTSWISWYSGYPRHAWTTRKYPILPGEGVLSSNVNYAQSLWHPNWVCNSFSQSPASRTTTSSAGNVESTVWGIPVVARIQGGSKLL